MPNKKILAAGVAVGLAVTSSVFAEETVLAAAGLSPVVVTPARTAQTVDESLAAVTVIDRDQIDQSQARDIPGVLRRTPGVQIVQQGGLGKQTGIHLRGAATNQTLVLVDGVRIGSATTGQAALQHIPLAQVERIEVVRGPRSALYGADAVGGVIQIFTRDGGVRPRASAGVRVGSERTREAYGSQSGGDGVNRYRLSASSLRTRGFDAQVPVDSSKTFEPDRDGYRQDSFGLRWGRTFEAGADLDLNLLHAEGDTEFDGAPNRTEFVQQVAASTLRFPVADDVGATVRLSESTDESVSDTDGVPASRFETRRQEVAWQSDVVLAPGHDLVAGFDWRRDEATSSEDFAHDERITRGLFAQYLGGSGPLSWSLALREDEDETFGARTTGDASMGYQLGRQASLFISYGTAFKAPTFNDLYWPASLFAEGNPDLDPETSETYEIGMRQRIGRGHWAITAYETKVDDLIDWAPGSEITDPWRPQNVDQARMRGAELEAGIETGEWMGRAVVTAVDAEDRGTGERLDRRPPLSGSLEVDRRIGRWSVGTALEGASYRYDGGGEKRLPGYGLIDLRASYHPTPEWTVRALVENALDKTWYTAWSSESGDRPETYYAAPERRFFVAVEYDF